MIAGLCWCLLFLFVPETFWERAPHPSSRQGSKRSSVSGFSIFRKRVSTLPSKDVSSQVDGNQSPAPTEDVSTPKKLTRHVGFAASPSNDRLAEPSTAEQTANSTSNVAGDASPTTGNNETGETFCTASKNDD